MADPDPSPRGRWAGWLNPFTRLRVRETLRRLPLIGRNYDYQRYIIISKGRSGSTMLVHRLDSHPQLSGLPEIFHPNALRWCGTRLWLPRRLRAGHNRRLAALRGSDPLAYAEQLAWGPQRRGVRAAGFKILWEQLLALPPEQSAALLAVPGLKVILLEREDALAQYVSNRTLLDHHVVHVRVGDKRPETPRITVEPAAFADYVRRRKFSNLAVRQLTRHVPRLSLLYETLVAEPERENARLCEFLGLSERPLRDGLQKVTQKRLADRIENVAELRRALLGTEMERYLAIAGIDGE